jgi:hypothetical protein
METEEQLKDLVKEKYGPSPTSQQCKKAHPVAALLPAAEATTFTMSWPTNILTWKAIIPTQTWDWAVACYSVCQDERR